MVVRVLGLGLSHDASAYALEDGEPVVGVQLERLTRRKHDGGVGRAPIMIEYVLEAAGWRVGDIDLVVAAGTSHRSSDSRTVGPIRLDGPKTIHVAHHLAHACSAFGPSGFDQAAVVVIDANGDPHYDDLDDVILAGPDHYSIGPYRLSRDQRRQPPRLECESIYRFDRSGFDLLHRDVVGFGRSGLEGAHRWSDALGLGHFYSEVSRLVFGDPHAAGKVMGLAPYGRAPFLPLDSMLAQDEEGLLLVEIWRHELSASLQKAGSSGAFQPDGAAFSECAALAALVQRATETYVLALAKRAVELTGSGHVCLAGGVALNAIANTQVAKDPDVGGLFVQPASSDSGLAVGAAIYGDFVLTNTFRATQPEQDELGRIYDDSDIAEAFSGFDGFVEVTRSDDAALEAGCRVASGQTIAWWSGGSEFGPRALGHRSIIGDPRRPDLTDLLNREVKGRELFRPFAPAVLAEEIEAWFDAPSFVDFMLTVAAVRPQKRQAVPAIVHVDGSTRLQAVGPSGGRFRCLIETYAARTGVPLVVNTSFNGPGEPMVESPRDALLTFLLMPLDALVLGDLIVTHSARSKALAGLASRRITAAPNPRCLARLHRSTASQLLSDLGHGTASVRRLIAAVGRDPATRGLELRELQHLEAAITSGDLTLT